MNNWISVKDRLPEKNGAYLVVVQGYITDKPYIKLLHFMTNLKLYPQFRYEENVANGQSGWWDGDGEGDWIVHDVTHWMSLPELPEEERH